ncbi:tetratricopeptide repeat protein [Xanthovirga aplysinae]|uniref:tetratricopeptide repeat protein n=1 Tax=Xanthovirga aplysinae TaxID=2529853 RepID=UPI00165719CE|nr:tetratricopeptide repeat protein [Xanthovirga aplysinae]
MSRIFIVFMTGLLISLSVSSQPNTDRELYKQAYLAIDSDPLTAIELCSKILENPNAEAGYKVRALIIKGGLSNRFGEYDKSLECFLDAYDLNKEKSIEPYILHNLGWTQRLAGNQSKAKHYLNKNKLLYPRHLISIPELALVYINEKEYEKARVNLENLKSEALKINSGPDLLSALMNLGFLALKEKDYNSVINLTKQAFSISDTIQHPNRQFLLANAHNNIAIAYMGKGNYQKAEEHLNKGFEISNLINAQIPLLESATKLKELSRITKDFDKLDKYSTLESQTREKLEKNKVEFHRAERDLREKQLKVEKEKTAKLEKSEKTSLNLIWALSIGLILVSGVLSVMLRKAWKEKKNWKREKRTNLNTLRASDNGAQLKNDDKEIIYSRLEEEYK